jgi:glycosyltransferase involved in cell wall biosynthesis
MTRTKIVHVIESLGRGGAERLLVTTLAHIDPARFENHVIYLFPRHDLAPEITAAGWPVTCLEMRGFWDWRRGLGGLRRLLRDLRPDIVHTVLQRADVYGRVAAASVGIRRVVSTLHECPYNPEVFIDSSGLSPFRYGLFKQLDRATARLCNDAFIVVSRATRANLQRYLHVPDPQIRLLYSGIDLEAVDRSNDGLHERIRAELGLLPGVPLLLNVARLFQQKGQRYLIRAMRKVVDEIPDAQLLMRGDGPDRAELQRLIAELGLSASVRILDGYKSHPEILALMRLSDVFVFPSLYEGLGIAPIEALALERPCVASKIGPLPEVVDDGETGVLVPSMDPAALAAALVPLLRDGERARRMGRAGRARVEERFDIRRNVRLLEQGYLDLLAGRWAQGAGAGMSMTEAEEGA